MSYDLSVVLLIPAQHHEAINQLAEELGYGPGNLSVPLIHADGSEWYGGHTWAARSFMDEFAAAPPEFAAPLAALVMSVIEGGNPAEHWKQSMLDNGLTPVEMEE